MRNNLLLADIGNTHFHIKSNDKIEHLSYEEAIEIYSERQLFYISVNHRLTSQIKAIKNWVDISSLVKIEGEYDGMGVDRKALCLSRKSGIFVDAGSAITVDFVSDGVYRGGYILAGLKASLESYRAISSVLDIELNQNIDLTTLPKTTKDGISYGIIASIKAIIERDYRGEDLYFTGGDGEFLSSFFARAIYDESLVFDGMRKVIEVRVV
ncbi:MAG: type III pantothenate kinase [Sulfurovum sp.]